MTEIANYEQWDYRKIFKIDPCNCEDEDCSTYIMSARGAFTTLEDVDDYEWVTVATFDDDLLVDLIKNCISAMKVDESNIDERIKLEALLGLDTTGHDEN